MEARARTPRILLAVMAISTTLLLGVASTSSAATVTVTDMAHGTTASDMAQALAGSGIAISNKLTFTGSQRGAGSFTGERRPTSASPASSSSTAVTCRRTPAGRHLLERRRGPERLQRRPQQHRRQQRLARHARATPTLDALSDESTYRGRHDPRVRLRPAGIDGVVQLRLLLRGVQQLREHGRTTTSSRSSSTTRTAHSSPARASPVTINTINNGNPGGDTHARTTRSSSATTSARARRIDIQMDGLTTVLTCTANVTAGTDQPHEAGDRRRERRRRSTRPSSSRPAASSAARF